MYDTEKWEKAASFHGHKCPGLAIGFKACQALAEHVPENASMDEELICITENNTCAADAVQSLLSCTFGKCNLIYKPYGKMAFNFYFAKSRQSLRVYYKGVDKEMPRPEMQEYILNAPTDELFVFSKPVFEFPERKFGFSSVTCEICGEKAKEDAIRIKDGKMVCLGCLDA